VLRPRLNARLRPAHSGVALIVLTSLLAVGLAGSPATGAGDRHGLQTRKHTVDSRIDQGKADVDDIGALALRAKARLDIAAGELADARARLSDLRS
jgi:hypothetical protein